MQTDLLISKTKCESQEDVLRTNSLLTSKKGTDLYQRFFSACITVPSRDILISFCEDSRWDWESMVRLASEELILPLLYNRLDQIWDILPRDIADVLRTARELAAERNALILEELKHVAYLANQLGVEPIALKGSAHLLRELYSSASDQYLMDIDLLVPEAAIKPLFCHLLENGYSADLQNPVGIDCHHELAVRRPGFPPIELHRSVGMGRAKDLLPSADLIQDSVLIDFGGVRLRTPSDEHILVHQILHAQLNDSYQKAIWPDLREVSDCRLLTAKLSASGQMLHIVNRFRGHGVSRLLELHFLTIMEILGASNFPIPFDVARASSFAWQHRRLLRAVPALRFLDPYYLIRSALIPRIYRLRDLAKSREGLMYVLKAPFRISFYRSLWSEMI